MSDTPEKKEAAEAKTPEIKPAGSGLNPVGGFLKRVAGSPVLKSQYFKMIFSLFIISAVTALLLAFVNQQTAPIIEEFQLQAADEARQLVLPDAVGGFEDAHYTPSISSIVQSVHRARDGSGLAVQVAPLGFGGAFNMIVGVDRDGNVTRVVVLTPTGETAGIGTQIEQDTFLIQYKGLSENVRLTADGGSVQAISGATVSSRAATEGVSAALLAAQEILRGGAAG